MLAHLLPRCLVRPSTYVTHYDVHANVMVHHCARGVVVEINRPLFGGRFWARASAVAARDFEVPELWGIKREIHVRWTRFALALMIISVEWVTKHNVYPIEGAL